MKRVTLLLLILLLIVSSLLLCSCQQGKNIKDYITSADYFYTTSDDGRVWHIRCFVDSGKFNVRSAGKIVVNVNGTKVTATLPSGANSFYSNYFDVEYVDSRNRDSQPTIRSCYAYTATSGSDDVDKQSSDLTVTIIVGVVVALVGAGVHWLATYARIPFIKYIPGAVFLICTIGAFATTVIDGIVMLAFFVIYLVACRAITKSYLN